MIVIRNGCKMRSYYLRFEAQVIFPLGEIQMTASRVGNRRQQNFNALKQFAT